MAIFGNILIVIGAAFLFLGALGLVRMPDVYNRIQAGTKAVTLGSLALLAGVAFIHPAWLPKSLLVPRIWRVCNLSLFPQRKKRGT